MRDNLRPVFIIAYREVRDQLRDWRIIIPIALLTLFFPFLMNFTAGQVVGFVQQYGANLLADRFIPFLLMIVGFFPITISLAIALESFAGETERRSIEPLLGSPLSDWQLYLGKLLASLIPPLLASYLGVIVYLIGIRRTANWVPSVDFLILVLLLTTVQALVMVSGAVVVSTQTTSVRAANLLASFIVLPMSLLIQGESVVMLWADYGVLWWAVLGQVILAGLLVRMGLAHFNREELLGKEIDTLNMRWAWKVFSRAFVGQARNPGDWLKHELPPALRRLAIPVAFMTITLVVVTWVAADQARISGLPASVFSMDKLTTLDETFLDQFREIGFFSANGVFSIWLHNLQTILIATLLGVLTFAVGGVLVLLLPMAIIGFFAGAAGLAGIRPITFLLAFIMPHGLFELPAIILSGAAILQIGAALLTPAHNMTIGEAWLRAFADWAKVALAVVMPLFLIASALEMFVSPHFMLMVLGGL